MPTHNAGHNFSQFIIPSDASSNLIVAWAQNQDASPKLPIEMSDSDNCYISTFITQRTTVDGVEVARLELGVSIHSNGDGCDGFSPEVVANGVLRISKGSNHLLDLDVSDSTYNEQSDRYIWPNAANIEQLTVDLYDVTQSELNVELILPGEAQGFHLGTPDVISSTVVEWDVGEQLDQGLVVGSNAGFLRTIRLSKSDNNFLLELHSTATGGDPSTPGPEIADGVKNGGSLRLWQSRDTDDIPDLYISSQQFGDDNIEPYSLTIDGVDGVVDGFNSVSLDFLLNNTLFAIYDGTASLTQTIDLVISAETPSPEARPQATFIARIDIPVGAETPIPQAQTSVDSVNITLRDIAIDKENPLPTAGVQAENHEVLPSQTFDLPAPNVVSGNDLRWSGPLMFLLNPVVVVGGDTAYLQLLWLTADADGVNYLWTHSTPDTIGSGSGPQLINNWENNVSAIVIRNGNRQATIAGPNHSSTDQSDATEPYAWSFGQDNTSVRNLINNWDNNAEKTITLQWAPIYHELSIDIEAPVPTAPVLLEADPINNISVDEENIVPTAATRVVVSLGQCDTLDLGTPNLTSDSLFWTQNFTVPGDFSSDGVDIVIDEVHLSRIGDRALHVFLSPSSRRFSDDVVSSGTITISNPHISGSLTYSNLLFGSFGSFYSSGSVDEAERDAFVTAIIGLTANQRNQSQFTICVEALYTTGLSISAETTVPTENILADTFVIVLNDLAISTENNIPTSGASVVSYTLVVNNITINAENTTPVVTPTLEAHTPNYLDIGLTGATPLPLISAALDSFAPIHSIVEIDIEIPPPTINTGVQSTGEIVGKYVWVARRRTLGAPTVGETIADPWSQPTLVGVPSIYGKDGSDGNGLEFIFAVYSADTIPASKRPNDLWGFDSPGTSDGLTWHDAAPDVNDSNPFLFVAIRMTEGVPAIGSQVQGLWSLPSLIGRPAKGAIGREFIFTAYSSDTLPADRYPSNDWGFDSPETVNGQTWQDGTPSGTSANPYIFQSSRRTVGQPSIGDTVTDNWSTPALISAFGEDGRDGDDGQGTEWVFCTNDDDSLPSNQRPSNDWGFDSPGTTNGKLWTDAAQETTSSNPYLFQATRRTIGSPSVGDDIADDWSIPVVISHFGVDGSDGRDGGIGPQGPQGPPGEGVDVPAPNTPTLSAAANGFFIVLRWTVQPSLITLVGTRIQVAASTNGPWYAPNLTGSGTDWKTGEANGYALVSGHSLQHLAIPLTPDSVESRTLYYRVRREVGNSVTGGWSNTASATARLILDKDIASGTIGANKVKAGFLNALVAGVVNYMTIGDIENANGLVVGSAAGFSPSDGDYRTYVDRNEFTIERRYSGAWQVMVKITTAASELPTYDGVITPGLNEPTIVFYERNASGNIISYTQWNASTLGFFGNQNSTGRARLDKDSLVIERRIGGSAWRNALRLYETLSGGGAGGHLDLYDSNGDLKLNLEPNGLDLINDSAIQWFSAVGESAQATIENSDSYDELVVKGRRLRADSGITLLNSRHSDNDLNQNGVYDLLSPSLTDNRNLLINGILQNTSSERIAVSRATRIGSIITIYGAYTDGTHLTEAVSYVAVDGGSGNQIRSASLLW